MNLQSHYDLKMARSDLKPEDIKRIKARGPLERQYYWSRNNGYLVFKFQSAIF